MLFPLQRVWWTSIPMQPVGFRERTSYRLPVDFLRIGGISNFGSGATLFRVFDMRAATPDILKGESRGVTSTFVGAAKQRVLFVRTLPTRSS